MLNSERRLSSASCVRAHGASASEDFSSLPPSSPTLLGSSAVATVWAFMALRSWPTGSRTTRRLPASTSRTRAKTSECFGVSCSRAASRSILSRFCPPRRRVLTVILHDAAATCSQSQLPAYCGCPPALCVPARCTVYATPASSSGATMWAIGASWLLRNVWQTTPRCVISTSRNTRVAGALANPSGPHTNNMRSAEARSMPHRVHPMADSCARLVRRLPFRLPRPPNVSRSLTRVLARLFAPASLASQGQLRGIGGRF